MTPAPLTAEDCRRLLDVSRETMDRLSAHVDLLERWQRRINLVSANSLTDVWRRHVLDSGQLFELMPAGTRSLLDIGSGAGFPGLVLAILGVPEVHLVESDQRKAAFLREAARVTGAPATVHGCRVESLSPFPVNVLTARACAPLDRLLDLAAPFMERKTVGFFPKGRHADEELTRAREKWMMEVRQHPSRADRAASILEVGHIERNGTDRR